MAIQLGQLMHHFNVRNRRVPHRWTETDVRLFRRDQDECFILVQAITALAFPSLQRELDAVRREIMELLELERNLKQIHAFGDVIAPTPKVSHRERWYDHQISPEFTRDPYVAGFIVPRALSTKLIKLHKQQIAAITDLTRASR